MLYWMSSEFILVAASSVVLCQASVSFNKKKNNEHEDSFIVWELLSVHGVAFYSKIKFPSLSGSLFLFMELLFTVKLMEY